jgi:hypothetical protein
VEPIPPFRNGRDQSRHPERSAQPTDRHVQSVLIKIIWQARDEVLAERTESLEANASSRAREFGGRHGQDTVADLGQPRDRDLVGITMQLDGVVLAASQLNSGRYASRGVETAIRRVRSGNVTT